MLQKAYVAKDLRAPKTEMKYAPAAKDNSTW